MVAHQTEVIDAIRHGSLDFHGSGWAMAVLFYDAALISYSSTDACFAKRWRRAVESYGIPASRGSFDLIGGGKRAA